jgi:hypothetical protein
MTSGAPRFLMPTDAESKTLSGSSAEVRLNCFCRSTFNSAFNGSTCRWSSSILCRLASLSYRSPSICRSNAWNHSLLALAEETTPPNAAPPKCGQWLIFGQLSVNLE